MSEGEGGKRGWGVMSAFGGEIRPALRAEFRLRLNNPPPEADPPLAEKSTIPARTTALVQSGGRNPQS
jgi:hypothetical protein